MKYSYLEITYRKGRPLAAYFYLPRMPDDMSVRTEGLHGGLFADFAPGGRAIGIEITSPMKLTLTDMNNALVRIGRRPVHAEDLSPLITT